MGGYCQLGEQEKNRAFALASFIYSTLFVALALPQNGFLPSTDYNHDQLSLPLFLSPAVLLGLCAQIFPNHDAMVSLERF